MLSKLKHFFPVWHMCSAIGFCCVPPTFRLIYIAGPGLITHVYYWKRSRNWNQNRNRMRMRMRIRIRNRNRNETGRQAVINMRCVPWPCTTWLLANHLNALRIMDVAFVGSGTGGRAGKEQQVRELLLIPFIIYL